MRKQYPFTFLETLLILSASWRMALMLSTEEGPFSLFENFRTALGIIKRNGETLPPRTWYGRGLLCVWCLTFWLIPATWFMHKKFPVLVWWFGQAGFLITFHELFIKARR